MINKRDTVDGIGILMVVLDNEYLSKMVDSLSNPAIGEFYIYGGESELLFGPETENQEVQEFISEIKAAEKEEIDSKRNGKYFVTGCYDTHMEWNYLCVGMVSAVLSSQWINILIVALVTCFVIIIASYKMCIRDSIVSQSGETADSLAALREAKEHGIRVLGIVNVVGSSICLLYTSRCV